MNIHQFVKLAIEEDIQKGDHSALACIPENATGSAELLVKENGVLAGIEIANEIFKEVDPNFRFIKKINDGEIVEKGDIAFNVTGNSIKLLSAERLVLNVMQRMSAIATLTDKYVKELEGLSTKVLDTRKTTPLIRFLEKEAVRIGGGHNHRMGLYDMIMLKDNPIDFAGGIAPAIDQTKKYLLKNNLDLKIEIEKQSLQDRKFVIPQIKFVVHLALKFHHHLNLKYNQDYVFLPFSKACFYHEFHQTANSHHGKYQLPCQKFDISLMFYHQMHQQ